MKAFLTNKYHNVLVYDFLYRIGFCIHNVLNNFYSKKYLKVDPIKNYQDFVDVVEEIKKEVKPSIRERLAQNVVKIQREETERRKLNKGESRSSDLEI